MAIEQSIADRFRSKVDWTPNATGCGFWTASLFREGYGRFKLDGRSRGAHRVAWELEHGPIPAGMRVLHRCDNPPCVNLEHLFLGTQGDNMRDMAAKGRQRAKLTDAQVFEIRASTDVHRAIASRYGISRALVSYIRTGTRWAHLEACKP